jgi:hypothetical protein
MSEDFAEAMNQLPGWVRDEKQNLVTGTPVRSGSADVFLAGLSVYWLYDARTFLADIEAGFATGRDSAGSGSSAVTVALLYPLRDRDVSPFVGGGVGYGAQFALGVGC